MVEINGMKVYENLPAHCVDLDKATVVTLASIIQDIQDGISDYTCDNITSSGEVNGIYWGRAEEQVPVIVVDTPMVTEDVLRSLHAAGVLCQ